MKHKILFLALLFLISGGFNIYIINDKAKNHTQQINNDISSQLSFLGGSLEYLKEKDNLRFISSTTGKIFYLSRSSNFIDQDTIVLLQQVNNFFINSNVDKIYKNKTSLSLLIKMLATTPNDKKTKMNLRNLIETLS